jgi:arylformamidase
VIYDITRPITTGPAVFPSDTRVTLTPVAQIAAGASVNVTALTMSVHAGTHVDAPLHYSTDGAGIDHVPLTTLIGRCRVVTLDGPGDITVEQLRAVPRGERLVLHTRASAVPDDIWDAGFAAIAADAAEWIADHGYRLIGVDAPSVDPADSKALPAHKTFLRRNVTIIENLKLTGVPDGEYELIALPLRIVGNDAAPARVILRALSL